MKKHGIKVVFVIRGYCSSPKLIEFGCFFRVRITSLIEFGCFFRVRIISLIEFEFEKGFGISSLDLIIELGSWCLSS